MGANTLSCTPTSCIVKIKVSGNADFTSTAIALSGLGGTGGGQATNGNKGQIGFITNGGSAGTQAGAGGGGGASL